MKTAHFPACFLTAVATLLVPLAAASTVELTQEQLQDGLNKRLVAQQHPVFKPPYDSHPEFTLGEGGKGMLVWNSYVNGRERIVGRVLPALDNDFFVDLSGGPGVFEPAKLAADGAGGHAVVWASFADGGWTLLGRRGAGKRWSATERLSPAGTDGLHPAIEHLAADAYAVSWVQQRDGRFSVVWARWTGQGLGPIGAISAPDTDAFRPQLVRGKGDSLWAVWDAYAANTSTVYARRLAPSPGPIERVSTASDRCLKPVAVSGPDGGLYVSWVRVTDIIGGAGAIDQMHTIQAARRQGGSWRLLTDADGSEALAELAFGLLAKIEPKPAATGGYMGRRRHPMLVRDGNALWLLWERKTPHAGATNLVTGNLLARRIAGGRVEPTVVLATGGVDYHLAHVAEVRDGTLAVMASSLPRVGQRNYSFITVTPASARRDAPVEKWVGWKPVALPMPEAEPLRHELRDGGRTYRLYWMDSHVHSGLTADAEGEPDEILFYARDRGRLDLVVMQENDFYNCLLTEWEYQMGGFYSRVLSRNGSFVALPGYEWTQRVPVNKAEPVDQPRFWSANSPNHRTVIYPRAGGPLVRFPEVGNDVNRLYAAVEKAGGVMHTQHAQFDFGGRPSEVGIEVTAGWGLYFLNPGRIHATLNAGHRAGFVGTSDSHRRNPGLGGGLTGIYATELTPEAVLEAYRARRVFATNGSRIAVEARANGVLMGQEATVSGPVKLTVKVKAGRPLRRVTLLRDGANLKVFARGGADTGGDFEFEDRTAAPGLHWYYWRIETDGVSQHYGGNVATAYGNMAWSSPVWVRVR